MRPQVSTEAHKTDKLGELVCSNSLGGDHLGNASWTYERRVKKIRF